MFSYKITPLWKSRLALFAVILIGHAMLAGCADMKTESALDDPAISSELPPEAAMQYLNSIASKLNPSKRCRYTTNGVIMLDGTTVPYTYTKLKINVVNNWWPGDDFITIGTSLFNGCLVALDHNKNTENLILIALHSLGVTELHIEY